MKRALFVTGTVLFLATAMASVQGKGGQGNGNGQGNDNGNGDGSKIQIGREIAPVPLDLRGKNRSLVYLGSYIVNSQADCAGCHSNPAFIEGGDPFLGQPEIVSQATYLSGGGDLFGPFVPRNLTPDANGHPARLTLEEFIVVMTTGADLKERPPSVPSAEHDLLQVMPWPVFKNMTTRELEAIYEYLSAIPCIGDADRCGG
ncbi:MAG: cytochrome C [Vicinamibacterales bacterium]